MAKYPKRPKAPKMSSSVAVLERFMQRLNDWEKKKKAIDQEKNRRAALVKAIRAKLNRV